MTTQDLVNMSAALTNAIAARFMSPEHAKKVWFKLLRDSQLDVPREQKPPLEAKASEKAESK